MKRDKVMAMTDEDLRFKASELMGITDGAIPDFPNDIASAWGLTSSVPGCRWSVYELDKGGWAAVVMGKIEPIGGRAAWDVIAESGPEDAAERAITIAFILAMTVDEEK